MTNILYTARTSVGLVSNNALEGASSNNTMWRILRFLIEALLCPLPPLPLKGLESRGEGVLPYELYRYVPL